MKIGGVKSVKFFAKGKRGKVYVGVFKGKKVAIKVSKRAENEGKWLKKLNKYKIGSRFLFSGKDYFVYEFVEGERILDYIAENEKKKIIKVLKNVFLQCRVLDKLKVDKKEMHNPWKHILIGKDVKMIDFERCHIVDKGKNVTQFGQFLLRKKELLNKKGIKVNKSELIKLLKEYKSKQIDVNFKRMIHYLR